jgi:hypothetical protein
MTCLKARNLITLACAKVHTFGVTRFPHNEKTSYKISECKTQCGTVCGSLFQMLPHQAGLLTITRQNVYVHNAVLHFFTTSGFPQDINIFFWNTNSIILSLSTKVKLKTKSNWNTIQLKGWNLNMAGNLYTGSSNLIQRGKKMDLGCGNWTGLN